VAEDAAGADQDPMLDRRRLIQAAIASSLAGGVVAAEAALSSSAAALPAAQPVAPVVGTWRINGNGSRGDLIIRSVDGSGNLGTASAFGQTIFGFWHAPSGMIEFVRVISSTDLNRLQIYTGYLMNPAAGSGFPVSMAGTFKAYRRSGGSAARSSFGWLATKIS
jgi:hypothetical protein